MNRTKTQQKKKGYSWSEPKQLVSVRVKAEENEMAERLSMELKVSKNRVFIQALRRLHASVFSD